MKKKKTLEELKRQAEVIILHIRDNFRAFFYSEDIEQKTGLARDGIRARMVLSEICEEILGIASKAYFSEVKNGQRQQSNTHRKSRARSRS